MKPKFEKPEPLPEVPAGIPTLNQMGFMFVHSPDEPYVRDYVDFAPKRRGPSLDIGAAYGVVTHAALRRGAHVIANDLDTRHLEILWNETPASDRQRLTFAKGRFPEELRMPNKSLGSILLSRVLHFMDGPTIERAASKAFAWLHDEGRIFLIAITPYHKNTERFIPVYEERKRQRTEWPGVVDDVNEYSYKVLHPCPTQIHFLEPDIVEPVFKRAGFTIRKIGFFEPNDIDEIIRYDGREYMGMIAEKKRAAN